MTRADVRAQQDAADGTAAQLTRVLITAVKDQTVTVRLPGGSTVDAPRIAGNMYLVGQAAFVIVQEPAVGPAHPVGGTRYEAPPPSGDDDSAVLQALSDAAQSTRGTVVLTDGTYKANIATQQSFNQPRFVGRGKQYTQIVPNDSSRAVIRFQGGSGGKSGGYVSDLTLSQPSSTAAGIALELADCCDVHWDRLGIVGRFLEGIRFHVTQAAGFCEFNSGEATIDQGVTLPMRYKTVTTTLTSFHGSGLTGGIVDFAGSTAVQIDQYAFPYNAPMSCTFFPHTPNASVFTNQWANSKPGFFGTLRLENQSGGVCVIGNNSAAAVLFAGEAAINTANTYFGQLYLCHAIYWTSSRTFIHYRPWKRFVGLTPGTTYVDTLLANGQAADVIVNVLGPNYAAWYKLSIWQNPFNANGQVTVLDHAVYNNGSGIGEVQFSLQNYQLLIRNDAFTSQYTAALTIAHQAGSVESDNLRQ